MDPGRRPRPSQQSVPSNRQGRQPHRLRDRTNKSFVTYEADQPHAIHVAKLVEGNPSSPALNAALDAPGGGMPAARQRCH